MNGFQLIDWGGSLILWVFDDMYRIRRSVLVVYYVPRLVARINTDNLDLKWRYEATKSCTDAKEDLYIEISFP